ncbi:MAG: response regulator [Sphingomonadaceae bacterium]|nr:response regulator [Sphingomonadaceae bacterium]
MTTEDRFENFRKISVGVSGALLVALLVWLTLSSRQAEKSRSQARSEEVHTLAVMRATDLVLRAAQNAETGQRGYIITRDQTFLEPLREAEGTLPAALARLRELTLTDPALTSRATRIDELANQRLRQVERSIGLIDRGQFNRPELDSYLRTGKQTMDQLRRELSALETSQQRVLRQGEVQASHFEALAGQWRALLTAFTIVLGVLCTGTAISLLRARRHAREQALQARTNLVLAEGRHLLQSIIDSSSNALFVKTRKGRVLFANTRFRQIVPVPLEDLRGVPLPPTEHPVEAAALAEADRLALELGERNEVDLRLIVGGEPRWFCVEKNPWTREGQIIGVIGIVRDITDVKLREAELERRVARRTADLEAALESVQREAAEREAAEESLRQLQKIESLGQLTGGIAHDFNNMLAVVMNSLDTARRKLHDGDTAALDQLISTALSGTTSAADLTSRLLAFARQQKLDPVPVEINHLIAHTQTLLARTLGTNIAVTLDLDPAAGWVEVDSSQLQNALVNLAVNARDAMPGGGQLKITTRRHEREIEILIDDTGCGMPPEQLSRVFDPFFTTKDIGLGTGLGLSQVHGFVAQSGGRITIRSTPNIGTTVCVDLPACDPDCATGPEVPQPQPRIGQGELVLLVEDEALVRLSTQSSLQALGYRVIAVANGYAALDVLNSDADVALVITDLAMPGINGRDLASAARLLRPGIPVLLTTGHEQRKPHGDDLPVLAKPYLLDQLAMAIASILPAAESAEQDA